MNKTILKMAVIGAGTMGAAIAASGARAGLDVVMLVRSKGEVSGAVRGAQTLETIVKKGEMAGAGAARIRAGVYCGDMSRDAALLADCDLIIEAVAEDMGVKRATLGYIFENCGAETIVGTNTSNISIAALGEALSEGQRARFMGIHFFNPVRFMDLVELIPHADMPDETVEAVRRLINDRFGKSAVLCKDTPGFIANRIGSMALATIMNATEEAGYSVAKADALTGELIYRPKQGAYKLLDLVGLDIAAHTVEYMQSVEVPEYEKPFRNYPGSLADIVAAGNLGNKTKGGFYKKLKGPESTQKLMWDFETRQYVPLEKAAVTGLEGVKGKAKRLMTALSSELPESDYIRRVVFAPLWLAMCVCGDISYGFKDIDLAMRGGYNWEKGPFELCDELGAPELLALMGKYGYEAPAWAREKIASDGAFYTAGDKAATPYIYVKNPEYAIIMENSDAVLRDIGGGVACYTLKTKANTFTPDAAALLCEAEREVERSAAFKAMVIFNEGGNFGAGANLNAVAAAIEAGEWDYLEKSIALFQQGNMGAKYLKKPVVAAAGGQALGGSAELLLHCSRICAHQELYAGLVEIGVGLVPAGGGCAELLFRASEGYEYGQIPALLGAIDAIVLPIAQAKFSRGAEDAIKSGYLRRGDIIVPKAAALLEKAKAQAISMADGGYLPPVRGSVIASGENGCAHLGAVIHTMSAGKFMTPHDCVVVEKLARIFSGGDALAGTKISEDDILYLERKAFMELCHEPKTLERIKGMALTGRPVRN